MQIISYHNADAPAGYEGVAIIINQFGEFHPVLIRGTSEEEARRKAQEFWDSERARFAKLDGRTKAGRALKAAQTAQDPEPDQAAA